MDISRLISLTTEAAAGLTAAIQIVEHIQKIAGGNKPDRVAIEELLLELYQKISQTHRKQLIIERSLFELQKEREKQEHFAEQAVRYQLAETDMGGRVYVLKPEHEADEPPHEICVTCYDDSQRSILQPYTEKWDTLVCPRCQSQVPKSYEQSRSGAVLPERVSDY